MILCLSASSRKLQHTVKNVCKDLSSELHTNGEAYALFPEELEMLVENNMVRSMP